MVVYVFPSPPPPNILTTALWGRKIMTGPKSPHKLHDWVGISTWVSPFLVKHSKHYTILLVKVQATLKNVLHFKEMLPTVLFSMKLLRKSSISIFPSRKSSAIMSDSSSASWAATFNLACRALALQLCEMKRCVTAKRLARFRFSLQHPTPLTTANPVGLGTFTLMLYFSLI